MGELAKFVIKNSLGTRAELTNFGATLRALYIQDKDGKAVNVVAGFNNANAYTHPDYIKDNKCLGATIGRFAGRISGGGFWLNNHLYQIEHQDGIQLHGGSAGFQYRFWEVAKEQKSKENSISFKLTDTEGIHGFPGTVQLAVTYTLTESNALKINYRATTNKPTVLNLTNHSYFNLNGSGSILDHKLQLAAKEILETDEALIPTGNRLAVANTRFDFLKLRAIGVSDFELIDTPFICGETINQVELFAPKSGICMRLTTNQPAIVVYTPPNFGSLNLSNSYGEFPAICFEAQGFPDAPNQPKFPSTVLLPGDTYNQTTEFNFSLRNP